MRRFARALTDDPEFSDELVKRSISLAVMCQDKFDSNNNIRIWLYAILRNLHAKYAEQNAPKHPGFAGSQGRNGVTVSQDVGHDLYPNITKALAPLSHEQREVLILVVLEEMSYDDASKVLNVSVGTVMSRLYWARRRFKTAIEYYKGHMGQIP